MTLHHTRRALQCRDGRQLPPNAPPKPNEQRRAIRDLSHAERQQRRLLPADEDSR